MTIKFDLLINWMEDLERQQEAIEAEMSRVREMLDASLPVQQAPKGFAYIEMPDVKGLIEFWIEHVDDYPEELAKARRVVE